MVVGYDLTGRTKLTAFDHTIAGVSSGVGTRFFVQPLDVLKIRFQYYAALREGIPAQIPENLCADQLQIEHIRRAGGTNVGKYRSMMQALRLIVHEEGVTALWKGHVPAQALSVVYGVVNFQTFQYLTKEVWLHLPKTWTTDLYPVTHFCCGSISAALATFLSFPFDVVRTRLIGQGVPKTYNGMMDGFLLMCRNEGFLSLYKGFFTTVVQVGPNTGFTFAFYTSLNHIWKQYLPESSYKTVGVESFICGGLAGFGAKIVTYPLDLVKKRLQIRGFEYSRVWFGRTQQYNGLVHCIKTIALEEGFLGFYKGLAPSLLKAVFSTGLTFFFYEQTCFLLLQFRYNS